MMTREGAAFIAELARLAPEFARATAEAYRLADRPDATPDEIALLWGLGTVLSRARRMLAGAE